VFLARLDLTDERNGIDVDQLSDLRNLTFDMNNNFLVGVGKTEFFVLDLREGRDQPDGYGLTFGRTKTFMLQP
jgi:hypothetical protein